MVLLIFFHILFGLLSLMCYHVVMCYIMILEKNFGNVMFKFYLEFEFKKEVFFKVDIFFKTCTVFTGFF